MIRKIIACLMVLAFLCLTACGSESSVECTDDVIVYDEAETKDPLRICVDLQNFASSATSPEYEAMKELIAELKSAGLEDVVVEYIPSPYEFDGTKVDIDNSSRASAIDRVRVEIMSGGGPDVFLATYMKDWGDENGPNFDRTDSLFKYPRKAMENGLFLPLDEYIENNTKYTEWDKLTQPVLEAGRNEEGQQIIPLSYTFPVLAYPKSEWEHTPDKKYTWNDLLTNPELVPLSLDLANCNSESGGLSYGPDGDSTHRKNSGYLSYIMGVYADFEAEKLNFTEEELLERVNEILELKLGDSYESVDAAAEVYAGIGLSDSTFHQPMTFLPLYNVNGGITAEIEAFAAVNRNTKRPEDAFRVIDLLLSKNFPQYRMFYRDLTGYNTIPMHEEMFQESTPIKCRSFKMTAENFEAFSKVREQITEANFTSEGTYLLDSMLARCSDAWYYKESVEDIVHEYYTDLERRVRE